MTNIQLFQKYLPCLILSCMLSCQKPSTEAIGFTIKGQISHQEAAKICPAITDEDNKRSYFVVEFFNWSNHNYYVNTFDSAICYVGRARFFDKNEEVLMDSVSDFFGALDLCKIAPKSEKRFLAIYSSIEPVINTNKVEISFSLYSEQQDSTFTIKKTFKVEDGKIVY